MIDDTYMDEDTNKIKSCYSGKVRKQLRDMFSITAILAVEAAINKKMDMMLKMEDRLFLNPLAKVKNVPKKPAKEEVKKNADLFG